jgi:hypothetical protein
LKNSIFSQANKHVFSKYFLIIAVVFISWLPVLFVPFINDDYQILGYNSGKTILSIFKSFWTPDVSYFYWRPLGNIIHPLVLILGGFNPFPFRLVSMLLYAFCCLVLFYTSTKINLNIKSSLILVIFFIILPSHEFQVAWIADQGESLIASLLLLSFVSYCFVLDGKKNSRKFLILFIVFFTASLLVKELAFAGIFIPAIAYIAKRGKTKTNVKEIIKHILFALGILCVVLLYRFIVIGGSPFNSPNFYHSGPATWIKNFFIYIPLAFSPPKALEFIYDNLHNWLVIIPLCAASITIVYLIIYAYRRLDKGKRNILITGVAWYVIFIIPALPKLMRWYVFTASIGLIWSLAVLFEFYLHKYNYKKLLTAVIVPILIAIAVYDFLLMGQWITTGKKFEKSLVSLNKIKSEIKTDSIFVWCVPDKLNRIPMMKLGVQQSIQWTLHDKNLEVFSPLRAELTSVKSKIDWKKMSDSIFVFHLYGGRFLPLNGRSESIIKKETLHYKGNEVSLNINTFIKNSKPQSIAIVKLKQSKLNLSQIYYNGNEFVKIE